MPAHLVMIVESDPRTSGRPAEGIRLAAGVAVWKKAQFTLILRGPAVHAITEWADDLVDEDHYTRYLPILMESGGSIRLDATSPDLKDLNETSIPRHLIEPLEAAQLLAKADHVFRF